MHSSKIIFSISMVKNEMDVIESFVRYNINYLDGMIILDNGSTDNTITILKSLKEEGLNLFIFEDENRDFDKILKINQLLRKTVDEFDADIIVPLDADEFLVSTNKGNPRKFLEELKAPNYYVAKWRIYVPDADINDELEFIPSKITLARDDSEVDKLDFYKVILPKELVKDYDVKLTRGCHTIEYDKKYEELNREINPNIQIAHFPIRSKEQMISKISVGWLNALCSVEKRPNDSYHWRKIFNQIKESEQIDNEDVFLYAKEFSYKKEPKEKDSNSSSLKTNEEIVLNEDPIDLTFCKNLELKYTDKKINSMSNLLEACEWMSLSYVNAKKDNKLLKEDIQKNKAKENKCEHILRERTNKLEETENELIFRSNKYRNHSQRLISKFPLMGMLKKLPRTGVKKTYLNWKGYHAIQKNNLLDVGFYLKHNPDVKLSGKDPIIHYIYHGFEEGRKPRSDFDGENYLKTHADVQKSNINPLVHYAVFGLKEKRK